MWWWILNNDICRSRSKTCLCFCTIYCTIKLKVKWSRRFNEQMSLKRTNSGLNSNKIQLNMICLRRKEYCGQGERRLDPISIHVMKPRFKTFQQLLINLFEFVFIAASLILFKLENASLVLFLNKLFFFVLAKFLNLLVLWHDSKSVNF